MKVRELLEVLSKQDPEMDVMVKGEDFDYVVACSVTEKAFVVEY